MTFDPDDPRLTAFALGELDDADRLAIEALLADSPEARRFVDEVRETAAMLSETLRREPSPGLSIVQRIELEARLGGREEAPDSDSDRDRDRDREPGRMSVRRLPIRRSLAALAAGLLLAMGGYGIGRLSPSIAPGRDAGLAWSTSENAQKRAPAAELALAESSEPEPPGMIAADAVPEPEIEPRPAPEAMAKPAETLAFAEPPEPGRPTLDGGMAGAMVPAAPAVRQGAEPEAPTVSSRAPEPGRGAGMGGGLSSLSESDRAEMPRAVASEAASAPTRPEIGRQAGEAAVADRDRGQAGQQQAAADAPESVARMQQLRDDTLVEGMMVGRGMMGSGMMVGSAAERLGVVSGPTGPGQSRAAKVEGGNVVEVVDLADGAVDRRITVPVPVDRVELDPTGTRLLATRADRQVSVYHVDSGRLLNQLRVELGPVPLARFGPDGQVILSDIGAEASGESLVPGLSGRSPEIEPVSALPIRPGTVSLDEVGRWLDEGRVPMDREVPVARLVNAPPYPGLQGEGGTAVSVDVRVVEAPWDSSRRLVRIALSALDPEMGDIGAEPPPVVAEGVAAEVEFNPVRVASYRPIGFEPRPRSPLEAGEPSGANRMRAGDRTTLLIEVEPVPPGSGTSSSARAFRYRGVVQEGRDELLTVTLSYREPGREDRRSVDRPVIDEVEPIDRAPSDVRLASAMAWFGLALAGAVEDVPSALDGASAMVQAVDEEVVPEYRLELLGLIARARSMAGAEPTESTN